MEHIEPLESLFEILEMLIARYGVIGIAAAMFAESAGVPFASTVVLLTAGTMILRGTISFWSILAASTIGITMGSIFSYILGLLGSLVGSRFRGNQYFRRLIFYDTLNKISANSSSRVKVLWSKYGNFSIFMAQLWGVTRTFISFPAGAMHMNFYLFIIYTFLGGAIFSLFSIALSIVLAGTMGLTIRIIRILHGLSPWLLLVPVVIITILLWVYFYHRKYKSFPGLSYLKQIFSKRSGRN